MYISYIKLMLISGLFLYDKYKWKESKKSKILYIKWIGSKFNEVKPFEILNLED